MSEIVNLTGLTIPAQQSADKTSFDVRPKFMEQWIASLPMANLGETSRLVFKALVEINRLDIPVPQRYKAMELLRKPCHYIVESLEKHFSGRPLPLNQRNRKISELARALLSELAVGYKIIARKTETSSHPDLKLLTRALHRSMSYQELLLLRSYQVYAPYPRGIWKELHTTYHFIESYDLHNQIIKDPLNLLLGNSSIDSLYKRILLLSLSMPYRLHRGEVEQACKLLEKFVDFTQLDTITKGSPPAGLFIIDLSNDSQPGYLAMHHSSDYDSCRLLNTNKMIVKLNDELSSKNSELLNFISHNLITRLLAAWSILSKRSFSRTQRNESFANVAFGLSAAHHFVSGEQIFSPTANKSNMKRGINGDISDYHSTHVDAISDVSSGPDAWNMNYSYSDNEQNKAATSTNKAISLSGFEYETIKLSMANISADGYCLVSQEDSNFSAQVGDLLAVRDTEDLSVEQWGICVVRRMLSNRNDNIELGIEMLTPNALAVAARLEGENDSQAASDYLRCLMLPELRAIEQPATLITPAMPFKPDSRIRIHLQDQIITAVLSKRLESTRSFSRFEFNVIEENISPDKGNSTNTNGLITDNDFDSIWSNL